MSQLFNHSFTGVGFAKLLAIMCLSLVWHLAFSPIHHAFATPNQIYIAKVAAGCPNAGAIWNYGSTLDNAVKDTIPQEWWSPSDLLLPQGANVPYSALQTASVMVRSRIMAQDYSPLSGTLYDYFAANIDTRAGVNPQLWGGCTVYTMNTVLNSRISYGNLATYQSNAATDSTAGNYIIQGNGPDPVVAIFFNPQQVRSTSCAEQSDDWKFCSISALATNLNTPAYNLNKQARRLNTMPPNKIRFEAEAFYARFQTLHYWWCQTANVGYKNKCYMYADPNNGGGYASNEQYMTNSPEIRYNVAFPPPPTPTNWYVWIRGRGCGITNDSVHVGINTQNTLSSVDLTGWDPCSYVWRRVSSTFGTAPYVVSSFDSSTNGLGAFETINIWMREDGMSIDRILLTSDINYNPSNDPGFADGY